MTHTSAPSARTVFAAMWIPILAYGAVLTVPAFLAVLGNHYGMSSAELGRLASAEWAACILGTYLTNKRSIHELTRWVPWACALAVIVNAAGGLLVSHVPLIYFHPLSCFGAGIAYGYVLKIFDASGKQQRNFGIFLALMYLSELAIFQMVNFLTERYTTAAVFIVYSVLAFVALLVTLATRAPLRSVVAPEGALTPALRPQKMSLTVLSSVAALGVSYAAFGMIWPFVQLMGASRGFTSLEVTNGASVYAITGIFGGLAAAALSQSVNRAMVLIVGLCVVLTSVYMMYLGAGYSVFFLGCAIFGFYWTFYCTLHVGIVARGDNTGRGIVMCGVSPSLGAIFGSFAGGALIQGSNYLPPAQVGAALCILGIALTLVTMARMKPMQPTLQRAGEADVARS